MEDFRQKAKEYAYHKYGIFFVDTIVTSAFLLAYQFLISLKITDFLSARYSNIYLIIALYILFFSLLQNAVGLPLSFYSGYVLEHKFSLSNQTIPAWIKDGIKKTVISFFIFLVLMQSFYLLLRKTGALWWLYAACAWLIFNIILAKVFPVIIIPLFYKFRKLRDENLKNRIVKLAEKASLKLIDIFEIDFSSRTKKANAALTGLGSSRRVLLADNLLNDFSGDEIEAVCAHEFGHHKLFHIWKIFLFECFASLTGFYILGILIMKLAGLFGAYNIYDIRIFPLIMLLLFIGNTLFKPVFNGFSRYLENQADKFTLKITNNPDAFCSLMEKLAKLNLSYENPPKIFKYLFYDHPPISERIKAAKDAQ